MLDAGDAAAPLLPAAPALLHHCHVVHHAVRLAFPRSGLRTPAHRRAVTAALGDAGERLRAARAEHARLVHHLDHPDPPRR